jgi:hypothetical protein
MDKLNEYRTKVRQLLTKYLQSKPSYGDVEVEQIFDPEHDHYQIMHIDIKNNKIWIQQNTTEADIALELMEMGIDKQDIVIGFHTPKMRQLSGFAVE